MSKTQGSFSPVVRAYRRGHLTLAHSHEFPQLLYASSGVMAVATGQGTWVVPPQRAVWVPPACSHETWMMTDVHLNSLYLRPSATWKRLDCKVIDISPLLRELILAAEGIDPGQELARRDDLVTRLILEELRLARSAASPIPMPQDARLLRLCRRVLADPSLHLTLDRLAGEVGGCSKTIARLFDRELGMSFRKWRELVQIANAIAHLAQGVPVKVAASTLGYTPSAFSVMLRRGTGVTPQAVQQSFARLQPHDARM
jgi:AraC-like DNA-binding protein